MAADARPHVGARSHLPRLRAGGERLVSPAVDATPGERAYALIERLYPICRSITGDGVRETLRIVGEHVPIAITEVPSGTEVLDWVVPPEWNIRDAYIADADGHRVVD